jgi:hypothetical protein
LIDLKTTWKIALINSVLGHFKITFMSSIKEVSSSKNLKIKLGLPFLNIEEKM